jgi:general secretion pathway protein I
MVKGFTLMEILVAVAVVAIALTAIIAEVSRDLHNSLVLRNKTLAQWVAMNKEVEWQIDDNWPAPGEQHGETEMAQQVWYWRIDVSATDDPSVRRLDISVADRADGDALVTLLAYKGRPAQ